MDSSEVLARNYLASLGYAEIRYEPDGNVPPDFAIEGDIAVEVRRLNQSFDDGAGPRGLEEIAIPLASSMRYLLSTFGPPKSGITWFVSHRFSRPLRAWALLRPEIRSVLEEVALISTPDRLEFVLSDGFQLSLFPAGKQHESMFLLGGYTDQESGGWLLSEIEANIQRCVHEKAKKVSPYRYRYTQWWLILVDHIGYGLDETDRELFKDQVSVTHDFDKIVLLDPINCLRAFEI